MRTRRIFKKFQSEGIRNRIQGGGGRGQSRISGLGWGAPECAFWSCKKNESKK